RKDGGAMRVHGPRRRRQKEQGQALIPIIIMIGLFLLAMLGVAMDYSQIWAHRQMAQAAADASCQAGAADLYLNAVDPSVSGIGGPQSFSWIGSAFYCRTGASPPPSRHAASHVHTGASSH